MALTAEAAPAALFLLILRGSIDSGFGIFNMERN
jgi:hypothetical protein